MQYLISVSVKRLNRLFFVLLEKINSITISVTVGVRSISQVIFFYKNVHM